MTWFADKEDGHNPLDNNGNDPNNHDDKGPGCSTIIAIAILLLLEIGRASCRERV